MAAGGVATLSLPELRALAYQYAARILDYPYDEDVPKLGEWLEDWRRVLEALASVSSEYSGLAGLVVEAARLVEEELSRLGRDYFQAEYVYSFELAPRGPACPLLESEYVKPLRRGRVRVPALPGVSARAAGVLDKLEILADLAEWYARFGLDIGSSIPDNLIVELEFMHYLAVLEAEAERRGDEGRARELREAQLRFIREHLGRWLPLLARCASERATLRSYAKLLEATARLVEADARVLEALLSPE